MEQNKERAIENIIDETKEDQKNCPNWLEFECNKNQKVKRKMKRKERKIGKRNLSKKKKSQEKEVGITSKSEQKDAAKAPSFTNAYYTNVQ